MAQAFSYAPKYEPPPGPRSLGEIKPRSDFKASAALAISEFFSDAGLGDTKGNYELASKLMDVTPAGPALDAASALLNQSEGAGLDVALALSDAIFLGPRANIPRAKEAFRTFADENLRGMSRAEFAKNPEAQEALRQATGWTVDPRNFMRYELPSAEARFDFSGLDFGRTRPLPEVMDYPSLYAAHPELQGVTVAGELMHPRNIGYADPSQGLIGVNMEHMRQFPREAETNIIHETQHLASILSGMPGGGDPRQVAAVTDPYGLSSFEATMLYRSILDEVLARTAQNRLGVDEAARAAINPFIYEVGDTGLATRLHQSFGDFPRVAPDQIFLSPEEIAQALELTYGRPR